MADIPSVRNKINDLEVGANKPVSTALLTKKGQNINYLIDERDQQETRITTLETGNTAVTSSPSVSQTLAYPSIVDITNLVINITPQSGKVFLQLNSTLIGYSFGATPVGAGGYVNLERNGVVISRFITSSDLPMQANEISFLDFGANVGVSNEYKLTGSGASSGTSLTVSAGVVLQAIEFSL